MMHKLIISLLFPVVLAAGLCSAAAQDGGLRLSDANALLQKWESDAAIVIKALEDDPQRTTADDKMRAWLDKQRSEARDLADLTKEALLPLEEQLNVLGPVPAEGQTEAPDVAEKRAEILEGLEKLKATGSQAELTFTRADGLLQRIAEIRRQQFTDQLLTRGPTPFDPGNWLAAGTAFIDLSVKLLAEIRTKPAEFSFAALRTESTLFAIGALLFALVMMFILRRAALRWFYKMLAVRMPDAAGADDSADAADFPVPASEDMAQSRTVRLLVGIGVTLTRLATPLIALFAARFAFLELDIFGPTGQIVLDGTVKGIAVFAIVFAIVHAFFAPNEPRLRLSWLDDKTSRIATWYSVAIALAMALNVALVNTGESLGWPLGALSILNAGIIIGGCLALWRLAAVTSSVMMQQMPVPAGDAEALTEDAGQWLSHGAVNTIRRIAYAVSVAAPLLALAGYFALSRFIFYNTLLSAAVIAAGVLLFSVAKEGATALSEATGERRSQKVEETDQDGGLLPVFFGFILTLAALPLLALIWGATTDDLSEVYFGISNGFTIGESVFRPGDILIAALVFGAGLFVTRVVQAIMRRTVMPRTRLDTGVRSSIVSGLGYIGFFIAALVAISAGGLDLSNLAFLGAALGVGIGFGLQNIVNNFVSGIILLIERPIKVGDWIEVAGTHGTVEKVNVRSTVIQTFDKASYIVPNSELISGAVMNMTHGNLTGRVIAPVGVAYGTDTRKVEKILLEILRAHPMILRRPAPSVVFKGFGADSLDFEARGFLRDVNWILSTHSDLNFEIDRRFREEEIEIPFKQADVNLKNPDALVKAIQAVATATART